MYLSATMTIDPSQLTHIRRKPTKGFRRFAELLTGNLLTKNEEHETFTALSIMQEINVVLRSIGVTDVVKFSKDDQVVYDDSASTSSDDMADAIESLSREMNFSGGRFDKLSLMLEHHLRTIALVIEIRILRVHPIGVYPIQIAVNGLDAEFQSVDGQQTLDQRLEQVFQSQQSYDDYMESKRSEFEDFIQQLEEAFQNRMRIDDLNRRVYANIVRPGLDSDRRIPDRKGTGADARIDADGPPIMQRYSNNSDSLMYLWMWSNWMHSHNTYCRDTTIVTESGQPVFCVGDEGFWAGVGSTLEPNAPFEPPDCTIEPVESLGGEVISGGDFGLFEGEVGQRFSTGWFNEFAFGGDVSGGDFSGDADAGGDGGGASCGSSCGGGGCGGGCGS